MPVYNVKVPPQFEETFRKAEAMMSGYFINEVHDPTRGIISIADDRYILIRAASMSVEFFRIITELFKDRGEASARKIATSMLFDIAHSMGKTDAENFIRKMNLKDPVEKLSAGPIHFAYMGWAFVEILPESKPSADENYYLIYDHPYSFESDSWMRDNIKATESACIMNSGYSSGWCEASFDIPLVAVEVECKAMGGSHDRFIMAQPSRIKEFVEEYRKKGGLVAKKYDEYDVPGFFQKKLETEEMEAKNRELEKINQRIIDRESEMMQLKKEIESLKSQLNVG